MAFAYFVKKRGKWYARWRDPHTGRQHSKVGFTDEEATRRLAEQCERQAARRPGFDPRRPQSLAGHVDDWYGSLVSAAVSEKHARDRRRLVTEIVQGCGWHGVEDLDADAAARYLANRRKSSARFGAATSNHYAGALRAFGRWLVRGRRIGFDPFLGLRQVNAAADPRHVRRTLTADELRRLFDAARVNRRYRGLTGPARSALYATAAYTGLRASELASLTAASLHLDADPPAVELPAGATKNGRAAVLPLHPSLVAVLRDHAATVPPGGRLWPGRWAGQCDASAILRRDLKRAGIEYRNAAGEVYDFHALRVQFVTDLARAGVLLQYAQKLARHSTPTLTAKVYTRFGLRDLADAVGQLPPVAPEDPPALPALWVGDRSA